MTITGGALIAGVIGHPIGHSKSPALHGYWLERYGIDGAYVPLAVQPENLAVVIAALPKLGFRGINVTVPHKEACLTMLDSVDPLAKRVGAVNTISFGEDGRSYGSNTDVFGFIENLKSAGTVWRIDQPALVLGAGGAARAIVAGLAEAGQKEIRVANRSFDRAAGVANDLSSADCDIKPVLWTDREAGLSDCGLLVNATTLGMTGQPPLDIGLAALSKTAIVTDIVYSPLETPLLNAALACGLETVDGLGMLLHQARPGFKSWFGVDPEVTPGLRTRILNT
jgi:shikimate dehydrogenase